MPRSRKRSKPSGGRFTMLPHHVFRSAEYADLSPRAVKLLIDIAGQYSGSNNGDMTCAWSVLRPLGWTSKDQLAKARNELIDRGFIVLTRLPRKRRDPALYGLTYMGIDPCGGKIEEVDPSPTALHTWRRVPVAVAQGAPAAVSLARRAGQYLPQHGAMKVPIA